MTKDEVITAIKGMTVLDLADLVKTLERELGVSAMAPMAAAGPALAAAPAAAEPEEEQSEFTVILTSYGEKKIEVIKAVREITALGLKEAKDLVEAAPKSVKEGATKEEAAALRAKLEAVGAGVDVK